MTKAKQQRFPTKALPRSSKSEKTKFKSLNVNLVTTQKVKMPAQAKFKSSDKGIIVKNFEFCTRVVSKSASTSEFWLNMNPGDATVFPWLSIIAAGYEKFKIHKLKVKYLHTCPATQAGQYAMYFDYDARDNQLSDMHLALQNYDRANGAVYEDSTLTYKKSVESLKSYYIQKAATPSASWVVDETPAKLNLLVADGINDIFVGNLFLDYEIELEVPAIDVAHSTTSLCITPTDSVPTGGSSVMDAIKNLIPVAVPGANLQSTGLAIQRLLSMGTLTNLNRLSLGFVADFASHVFTEANLIVQNTGSGYPNTNSIHNIVEWLNSGTIARQLVANFVIPPRSSVTVDLLTNFHLGSEFDLPENALVPFAVSNVTESGYATVSNSWTMQGRDHAGPEWDRMWRFTGLLQNTTDAPAMVIAGLRQQLEDFVIDEVIGFRTAITAALAPFNFDYSGQLPSLAVGSRDFSRPYRNYLSIGDMPLSNNSTKPPRRTESLQDQNKPRINPKPPLLKTPENFRDHTSKIISWQQ